VLNGLIPVGQREPRRRGHGIPTLNRNRLPRGLVSCPIVIGAGIFDPLSQAYRRFNHNVESSAAGARGEATPIGWASRAWYARALFSGLPASTENRHSTECWVYFRDTPGASILVDRGPHWGLRITSDARARAALYDGAGRDVTGATTLVAGTLNHIALVHDGANVSLYVNGVLDGTGPYSGPASGYGAVFQVSDGGPGSQSNMLVAAGDANHAAWSAGEVLDRARNPWSHLVWPEERLFHAVRLAGAPADLSAEIAGTVDITASVAAALALDASIAGTVDITASAAASLALAAEIAGTVDITASIAAQTDRQAEIAGTVPITAEIAAQLDRLAEIAGTIPITASITAFMEGGAGDTHDGFLRRSRRQRALEAAERRRDAERLADARALRLELEAALGMAADAVEEAPPVAVEAVREAVVRVQQLAPLSQGRISPDPEAYSSMRAAVSDLLAAIETARRAKELADDDEDVEILLRAL
jgi:hypothetical protein